MGGLEVSDVNNELVSWNFFDGSDESKFSIHHRPAIVIVTHHASVFLGYCVFHPETGEQVFIDYNDGGILPLENIAYWSLSPIQCGLYKGMRND